MKVDTLSFVLGLLSLHLATARPTPPTPLVTDAQSPFILDELEELLIQDGLRTVDEDGRDEAMIALLDKYAPVLKLSAVESYFPSSIEYMLPHYYYATVNGTERALDTDLLNPSLLDRFPRRGQDYYLSITEPHNPQPFLDPSADYLFGPAGQPGAMAKGDDGRGRVKEVVYGFWVDQGRGVVDLWYWTFYPFNFGKFAGPFGILGNHVGDWERLRMRTVNGTAVSVDYNAHSGGPTVSGTVRWEDVEKIDGRPVGYVAAGSHGLWGVPGEHELAPVSIWHPFNLMVDFLPSVSPWPSLLRNVLYPWVIAVLAHVAATLSQLLDLIKVVDITDDEGPIWDTKGSIVPFRYWNNPGNRTRIQHKGMESWLNFRGSFGNKGDHNCWWYKLVESCQIADAPPGPNRWFGYTPQCLIAEATQDISQYSFYLSPRTVNWAERVNVTYIRLEQMCRRPKRKNKELVIEADLGTQDSDGAGEDDVDVWAVTGTSRFHKEKKHEISTMYCNGVKAAVKSYRLSFCLTDGKCIYTTGERRICAYEDGRPGYVSARAVKLDDLDDWWEVARPEGVRGR